MGATEKVGATENDVLPGLATPFLTIESCNRLSKQGSVFELKKRVCQIVRTTVFATTTMV